MLLTKDGYDFADLDTTNRLTQWQENFSVLAEEKQSVQQGNEQLDSRKSVPAHVLPKGGVKKTLMYFSAHAA